MRAVWGGSISVSRNTAALLLTTRARARPSAQTLEPPSRPRPRTPHPHHPSNVVTAARAPTAGGANARQAHPQHCGWLWWAAAGARAANAAQRLSLALRCQGLAGCWSLRAPVTPGWRAFNACSTTHRKPGRAALALAGLEGVGVRGGGKGRRDVARCVLVCACAARGKGMRLNAGSRLAFAGHIRVRRRLWSAERRARGARAQSRRGRSRRVAC